MNYRRISFNNCHYHPPVPLVPTPVISLLQKRSFNVTKQQKKNKKKIEHRKIHIIRQFNMAGRTFFDLHLKIPVMRKRKD